MQPTQTQIAVIAGDGIGQEVMPEGLRVLQRAITLFDLDCHFTAFDFANCDYYARHGQMLPADWKAQLSRFDAIYFGAVGWPAAVPDHVSLWGSLIAFRRQFDQYVNLRPARLMPGLTSPLVDRAGQALQPGAIDMLIIRENTEGEYSSVGGRMFAGTEREFVVQQAVFTRTGVDRILRYAFEAARARPKKHLTSATKSNGIAISMPYWDERFAAMALEYPDVTVDQFHIDILAAHFVRNPQWFDVVVASNLFGDILSDLAPACTGTIAIAPSANINPSRACPSLFEPVHGSAPDIAGRGVANPIGQIWAGAMMLDFLAGKPGVDAMRYRAAHNSVVNAIELICRHGPHTNDMHGNATTEEVGRAIAAAIAAPT